MTMTDDLIKRLWESDAASALTNEAARCIEAAQAENAALGWVWWRADDALGDCEAGIRADEAAQWLRRMEIRRVG